MNDEQQAERQALVFRSSLIVHRSSFLCHPTALRMQQFLYFLPLPHGHGSLRPTRSPRLRIGSGFFSPFWLPAMACCCWSPMLPACPSTLCACSCVAAPIHQPASWTPSSCS